MSKLKNGMIPKGTPCPFSDECGACKYAACNGEGCGVANGDTKAFDMSCGMARFIDAFGAAPKEDSV